MTRSFHDYNHIQILNRKGLSDVKLDLIDFGLLVKSFFIRPYTDLGWHDFSGQVSNSF